MARKLLLGPKLRRLRQARQLSQVQLADKLSISASYLNLIEHNQRAITVPLLLKLAAEFQLELADLSRDEHAVLLSELTEIFGDVVFEGQRPRAEDLIDWVQASPQACGAVVGLYRAFASAREQLQGQTAQGLAGRAPVVFMSSTPPPEEEVSDFLQDHQNHFPALEEAAEHVGQQASLASGETDRHLVEYLKREHAVQVRVVSSDEDQDLVRRYDPQSRVLLLSEVLPPRSRSFQLAHQLALLGCRELINGYVAHGKLGTADARSLARIALANYFAGAVLMPYESFRQAARSVRYDIEMLGHRFRTSFEQVCHRLTTLQRPGALGVPFHFIRVDIAGNISKRFSASGIRFARYSGSCPRWNVHTAFLSPGFIRTQLSRMPDGTTYFCVARTVRREGGGFRVPQSRLAIGLGCEVRFARELVYADGVDLGQLEAAVPIGSTCRLCDRTDCRQRAFPPLQQRLAVDENVRGLSFYVPGGTGPAS
ncbi:MAG: helix-turn-helix domain-containing protein [Planctomycetota bacterium]